MSISTHTQESNDSVIETGVDHIKATSTAVKVKIFDIKFETWEPDNLHWVAPSNIIIYSDGSWFIYAAHISNMRRTGGFLDTGDYWTWLVNIQFLNAQDSVIHANDYVLGSLHYKTEVDNATAQGVDSRLAELEPQIVKAQSRRVIR